MQSLKLGNIVYGRTENESYEIIDDVGSGSFGKVYQVRNKTTGEIAALKTIDIAFLDRTEFRALKNEGQFATGIRHPNVVNIFFFHSGEQYPDLPPYMLMEFVSGGTLDDQLKNRKSKDFFTLGEMQNTLLQLATGMKAINERLVHRDIKPDNILFEHGIYKISDFGLSKVVGAATRSQTFKDGGHIMYSAPEAWRSEENLPNMDMYSMGIVFFQVATLGFPYKVSLGGNTVDAWKSAHLFQQPLNPSSLNPDLDVEIAQTIMKMISKRPSDRYQSWNEVIERLQRIEKSPVEANVEGISALLRRDLESRRKTESEALQAQKRSREEQEDEGFIEYSFNQILQAATQIVEAFNRSSEFTKLKVTKQSRFQFMIETEGNANTASIQVEVATATEDSHFRTVGFMVPTVKAWGVIRASSGYGFNIVLVTTGQDDLYGEWRVIYKNLAYPNPSNMREGKMAPFDMTELPNQSSRATSGMFRGQKTFSGEMLLPLLEDLL